MADSTTLRDCTASLIVGAWAVEYTAKACDKNAAVTRNQGHKMDRGLATKKNPMHPPPSAPAKAKIDLVLAVRRPRDHLLICALVGESGNGNGARNQGAYPHASLGWRGYVQFRSNFSGRGSNGGACV